jgi:hypothetical protein
MIIRLLYASRYLKIYGSFNPLKLRGKCMYHLLRQSATQHCNRASHMILTVNSDYFLKQR